MPFYHKINTETTEGSRIAERLLTLKEDLRQQIPEKSLDQNLLLATWNIRDFDKPSYGRRSDEAIYYIAEIISRFDIVAIQEVYKSLEALDRVIAVLGGFWKYMVTDVTSGRSGNSERMAYLYDSRKIRLGGLAGELVLPPVKAEDGRKVPANQVWRTPYICGFKSGWSRFMLCSVHILWGSGGNRRVEPANRVEEIKNVAQFLKERTKDKTAWSRNLILLGDFNIFSTDNGGEAFKELTDAGFEVPHTLRGLNTNTLRTRPYDQIAFRIQKDRLDWTHNSGTFNFFDHVYRDEDRALYADQMGDAYLTDSKGKVRDDRSQISYYRKWRTHQLSDHLPLWVELKIDFSQSYLRRKIAGRV